MSDHATPDDRLDEIVRAVCSAPKYRELAEATVVRAATLALRSHGDDRDEAIKFAKTKLHQWVGAYRDPDIKRFGREVDAFVGASHDFADRERFARRALVRHSSTAERIEEMERIYACLLRSEANDDTLTILDLCGGMHAFALPFFRTERRIRYRGFDCDGAVAKFADRFVRAIASDASVECRDVIADPPSEPCDVAWLFKAAPCLERQESGVTRKLISGLVAKSVVLSFPTRSLGGRDKGMVENYSAFVTELAHDLGRSVHTIAFESETFHVLEGRSA